MSVINWPDRMALCKAAVIRTWGSGCPKAGFRKASEDFSVKGSKFSPLVWFMISEKAAASMRYFHPFSQILTNDVVATVLPPTFLSALFTDHETLYSYVKPKVDFNVDSLMLLTPGRYPIPFSLMTSLFNTHLLQKRDAEGELVKILPPAIWETFSINYTEIITMNWDYKCMVRIVSLSLKKYATPTKKNFTTMVYQRMDTCPIEKCNNCQSTTRWIADML